MRARLTTALTTAHEAPELAAVMRDLLLLRFDPAAEGDFQLFLDWQQAAEAAGYPQLR